MKEGINDLAILNGKAEFEQPLHVGAPNIGDQTRFFQRLQEMFDSRRLSNNGPMVREFEARLASEVGVKHCIAMCNGTVALEIAIRALGWHGEVIVPSFTFIATAHALQWQQITPVFCDIDPRHYTIDPAQVEALITPRTTGILGVHLWGRACDVDALNHIAKRHNIGLLFDAAHAFRCSYRGQMIGSLGDAEVFSFHATKFFNTFEGGAVVTNNDELAEKIRFMNNFGFAGRDQVDFIGINGKMSEVSAAMGLTSLESVDHFVAINRRNYQLYRRFLQGIPGVSLIHYNEQDLGNFQYVVIEIDERVTGISRDLLLKILEAENVLARRYFYPGCHAMEPYRSYFPHAGLLLPHTQRIARRVLSLPTGTAIEPYQIESISKVIRLSVENAAVLKNILPEGDREVPTMLAK